MASISGPRPFLVAALLLIVTCIWLPGDAIAASQNSESASTILTGTNSGEGEHLLTASGFQASCQTVSYSGVMSGTAVSSFELHPEFSGCDSSLGAASVDSTGCNYVVSTTTNGTGHLPVSVSCTGTNKITITAPGCTLAIGTQNTTGGYKSTNLGSGSGRDITMDSTVTMGFTKTGSLCFVISGNTGTTTGNWTMRGFENSGGSEGFQVGIWWA